MTSANEKAALFVKSLFNGSGAASLLISIGLASADGRECYVELPPSGGHLLGADEALLANVVSQLGLVRGARVENRVEMGDRVVQFLGGFDGLLQVSYDHKADFDHLRTLVGMDGGLIGRLRPNDVSASVAHADCRRAGLAAMDRFAARGIGPNHALAEVVALRAAATFASGSS